jgi:alkylation response protein AidB-like acyl-CoA dehydrogenase
MLARACDLDRGDARQGRDEVVPNRHPRNGRTSHQEATRALASLLFRGTEHHEIDLENSESLNHTIFEGTSEIQQLVISRAISGLRIE